MAGVPVSFSTLVIASAAFAAAQLPTNLSQSTTSSALPGTAATGTATPALAPGSQAAATGVAADWWSAVRANLAREEYHVSVSDAGLQAPNRAQNLRTYFRDEGIEVVPRTTGEEAPPWRFTWRTTAFGRGARPEAAAPAVPPRFDGSHVTYDHGAFDEWYENGPQGLEQGFTIREKPPGRGALRIVGSFGERLHARFRPDEAAVDFLDVHEAQALRYGALNVRDAAGADVRSRLEVTANEVSVVIEDDTAIYPLTVDPLMTSPAWTAESNQANAYFGISAGTAGDVNGDGYSDVIIGASYYDNGQTDEGRAFVYLGSAAGLATAPAWTAEADQASAYFGCSVGTAGDVNGDGYDDVIVGAKRYDNGQSNEGRAWVYHGSATGPSTTAAWTGESDQASAYFGCSVATAGDVNADGYDDVIVGAYYYDNGQTNEGRAYVYHGSAAGLASAAAWTAESDQAEAVLGYAVAGAGDVNGDGYADVIVGAYLYDGLATDNGRVFAYHGSASGLQTTPAWWVQANLTNSAFGRAVGPAGDVNGDGYDDVIVGADLYDYSGVGGRAYVYQGSASGLSTGAAWTQTDVQLASGYGASVGTAGDVNGDGYADVIVGAPTHDDGDIDEGRAFVYLGSAAGLAASPFWSDEANQIDARYGTAVATAGDVNGDGYSDVLVGAYSYTNGQTDEGRAYVYHGAAGGLATSAGRIIEGGQAAARLGYSVGCAGDVNGDGYSDVIVGAPLYDTGYVDAGRALVFHGSPTGVEPTPSCTMDGLGAENLGWSVSTAGDVNGDGYSDVVVGAPHLSAQQHGVAEIHLGSPTGVQALYWRRLACSANYPDDYVDEFGYSVAAAGDVNGDGYSDVVVGAPSYPRDWPFDQSPCGAVTVFYIDPDHAGYASDIVIGIGSTDHLGRSVASAGDWDGDGFADILAGAPGRGTDQGGVLLRRGSRQGLTDWSTWAIGTSSGEQLGESVADAGDVNGDGLSDMIACGHNGNARLYVSIPPNYSQVWSSEDPVHSVSSAGDVNGDGYADILVGSPWDAGVGEGQVKLYLGTPTGVSTSAAWTVLGGQADSYFGFCVANAGDVNGDGYSDAIIGAYGFDGSQANEGRAIIYYGGRGRPVLPQQVRTLDSTPIAFLGQSDSETSFRVKALGHTPAGRGKVRLQVEVKPGTQLLDGTGILTGPITDTGPPGPSGSVVELWQLVDGLSTTSRYHWRLRVLSDSPFFPRRPHWISLPYNGPNETDVWTFHNPGYTPVGNNVEVELGGVTVTFPQVTSAGVTTCTPGESGPPPPTGFQIVPVSPPVYYEVSTTATFTGDVEVCIHYNDADVIGNERDLQVFHYDEALPGWVDITWSHFTELNYVCGHTPSLSPFILAEPAPGVGAPEVASVAFGLSAASPSPFRGTTTLAVGLPAAGPAEVRVYDAAGRLVRELVQGTQAAGRHTVTWDGRDDRGDRVASGVYFVRLEALGKEQTRRVVRIR